MSKNLIVVAEELAAFKGCDDETVKNFISKEKDTFRKAHRRDEKQYLRTGILIGTTNKWHIVPEAGENRRWIIVPHHKKTRLNYRKMELQASQVMAEAYENHYIPWLNSRMGSSAMPPWEGWCHRPEDFDPTQDTSMQAMAHQYMVWKRNQHRRSDTMLEDVIDRIMEYAKMRKEGSPSISKVWSELHEGQKPNRETSLIIGERLRKKGLRRKSFKIMEQQVKNWVFEG